MSTPSDQGKERRTAENPPQALDCLDELSRGEPSARGSLFHRFGESYYGEEWAYPELLFRAGRRCDPVLDPGGMERLKVRPSSEVRDDHQSFVYRGQGDHTDTRIHAPWEEAG
ncbi:hypothetical protein GCM10028796_32680 [Ramlibacter monticola]